MQIAYKPRMQHPPRIYALIVAGGIGQRAGGQLPKQYQPIGSKPMLRYSLEAFASHPRIEGVQVVIHPEHGRLYATSTQELNCLPVMTGGATRADSVRAGLEALAAHQPDYVLIHDAARPFLSHAMIDKLVAVLTPECAVLPALAIPDTVRRVMPHATATTHWEEVARDGLMRIQTPQCFPFVKLQKLLEGGLAPPSRASALTPAASGSPTATHDQSLPTDDAALWLDAGLPLAYVVGDEELRKVTTAEDIAWANARVARAWRTAAGSGYDVHALIPGDGTIRLGGIDIAHTHKLDGHSDADVVLHAVVDALLGAIAAGDIGSFFPPTDARWKGANSAIFVEEARAHVAARGGVIEHLDITIISEQPKIGPHREAMRASIAGLLRLPLAHVSVKATTTEKLGFTGREEGISCHAIATVRLPREES